MRKALLLLALALVAGCTFAGPHHPLDAQGAQAERIASLFTGLTVVATITFVLVLAAWTIAARRGRARIARGELADETEGAERRAMRGVGIAVAVSALVLLAYVGASAATGRRIASMMTESPPLPASASPAVRASLAEANGGDRPLTIEVTAKQWWWEFRYHDPDASRRLTTANELHIPVGRRIQIIGTASDVIHSFWVPNLHGKQDLIPGYRQTTWLRADTAGTWVGECGEFCGHQHAKMRFLVVAEEPDAFARWFTSNLAPAVEPADSVARRGRDVFLANACVTCHLIDGTPAASRVGPPLTHVASRKMLAAATIPNTRGSLAGWILDPQRIKPGVRMPPNQLAPSDLDALLTYLESLR